MGNFISYKVCTLSNSLSFDWYKDKVASINCFIRLWLSKMQNLSTFQKLDSN